MNDFIKAELLYKLKKLHKEAFNLLSCLDEEDLENYDELMSGLETIKKGIKNIEKLNEKEEN